MLRIVEPICGQPCLCMTRDTRVRPAMYCVRTWRVERHREEPLVRRVGLWLFTIISRPPDKLAGLIEPLRILNAKRCRRFKRQDATVPAIVMTREMKQCERARKREALCLKQRGKLAWWPTSASKVYANCRFQSNLDRMRSTHRMTVRCSSDEILRFLS